MYQLELSSSVCRRAGPVLKKRRFLGDENAWSLVEYARRKHDDDSLGRMSTNPWWSRPVRCPASLRGSGRAAELFTRNSVADGCGLAAGAGAPPEPSQNSSSDLSIQYLSSPRCGAVWLHSTFNHAQHVELLVEEEDTWVST